MIVAAAVFVLLVELVQAQTLSDCQIVHGVLPKIFQSSDVMGCCSGQGIVVPSEAGPSAVASVTCDDQGAILSLSLVNLGTFTNVIVEPLFTLTKITKLEIESLSIAGSIPSLPSTLQYLSLGNNKITGMIPTLPPGLEVLKMPFISMMGPIPTLPTTLTFIMLSSNWLNGTIPTLPPLLYYLDITQNAISGPIPAIPSSLRHLRVGNNKLVGPIPTLPLTMSSLELNDNFLNQNITDLPQLSPDDFGGVGFPTLNGNCFANAIDFNVTNNPACTVDALTANVTTLERLFNIVVPSPPVSNMTSQHAVDSPVGGVFSTNAMIGIAIGCVAVIGVMGLLVYRRASTNGKVSEQDGKTRSIPPSLAPMGTVTSSTGSGSVLILVDSKQQANPLFSTFNTVTSSSTVKTTEKDTESISSKYSYGWIERESDGSVASGNEVGPLVGSINQGLPYDIADWSVRNVADWVYMNNGGEKSARNVVGHKVDGRVLLNASVDDVLAILDFDALGDRIQFKLLLTELKERAAAPPAWEAPPEY
ncbi:L domain-like protein [Rhizoclosmatium globosum]|uniref:L domain-like protein n=1 Tax=Rhizoclosmatium globosum TaxID=329046 RepID=A0A1Y2B805_9FUNG|nr:L domain-like protein [Rhizoclosmatium globosum]|eukprot:ORY30959.1 L domain-like protein [Rhizoclosmatium globosum]